MTKIIKQLTINHLHFQMPKERPLFGCMESKCVINLSNFATEIQNGIIPNF